MIHLVNLTLSTPCIRQINIPEQALSPKSIQGHQAANVSSLQMVQGCNLSVLLLKNYHKTPRLQSHCNLAGSLKIYE